METKDEQKSRENRVRKALGRLIDEIEHVKIDAVPNIFHRELSIVAFSWLLLFMMSSGACIYLICDAVAQYNEHKVTTTVRFLTEQEPTTLPTITVCNTNPFTSNFSLQLLAAANVSTNTSQVDFWHQYLQIEAYMNATRGSFLTIEEKLALSNFDQWIIPLKISSAVFTYERIFHPKYFGCLRFNANGTMSTTSTTVSFFQGLLYTGYAIPTLAQVNTPHIRGFYLFVQNATDDALGVDRNPILVTTGLSVQLAVSRKFYRQHPAPYSNCAVIAEDNSLSSNYINYSYTRKACLSLCAQVRTSELCGCNSNRIGFKVANFTDCSLAVELECAQDEVWSQIASLNAFCSEKCPIECSQSVFDVGVNYGSLSLQDFNYNYVLGMPFWCYYNAIHLGKPVPSASSCQNYLTTSPYLGFFYKDVVQVAIGYESLAYVDSLEEPKLTGDDLLGVIGGHLSLLLGMSLLSLLEVVELAVLFVQQLISSTNQKEPLGEVGERVNHLKMDALPNVVRSHSAFMSVVWFILFLLATGVCAFLIFESISQYFEYKVSATVTLRTSDTESQGELDSPRITICNLHPFTNDYAFAYIYNITRFRQSKVFYQLSIISSLLLNNNLFQNIFKNPKLVHVGTKYVPHCPNFFWFRNCFLFERNGQYVFALKLKRDLNALFK